MRFFTFLRATPDRSPILYKMGDVGGDGDPEGVGKASDLQTFTIIPIQENFFHEYEDKDIVLIAEHTDPTNGKQLGFFKNGFVLDVTLRELDFTDIDQFISFIKDENIKVINWFLETGIDVNRKDMYGNYPIMYVKNFYILKMLRARNATFNQIHTNCDNDFTEPVYNFIIHNFDYKLYIVQYLIKHGLDVTLTDGNGDHFLYRTDNIEIHKIFMKHGLDIKSTNNVKKNIIDHFLQNNSNNIYTLQHFKLWTNTE